MSEPKQEYTGTFIPAGIMLSEELKPLEKMLYAEIASFPICWASNAWFGERIGVSGRTISKMIQHLKELKFIIVEENLNGRTCIANWQSVKGVENISRGVEIPSRGVEKSSNKNNNINNNKEKTHTSAKAAATGSDSSTGREAQDASPNSAPPLRSEGMIKLFNTYASILHPNRKILMTDKRLSHMRSRLKEFKPTEIQTAAENLMKSSWHTGENPTKTVYASFDFLMRNDEKVEEWLSKTPAEIKKSIF